MSLPYDATPPPEDTKPQDSYDDAPSGLDQALDDYTPDVPDHVKSLMGRLSSNRVYLLEESPAILHTDGKRRIERDPRLRKLANELDKQDPTPWLEAIEQETGEKIKMQALYLQSELIQHLSTAKVFTWCTQLGSRPMGIEWLNDNTLHILFPDSSSALLSLSLLAKAGFDPDEGDDPLSERPAHSFPVSLFSRAGNETEALPIETTAELGPDTDSAVTKRGRGMFASQQDPISSSDHVAQADVSNIADGISLDAEIDPFARIALRYALESDSSLRKGGGQSEWYKKHGRGAGKETSEFSRSEFDNHGQRARGNLHDRWDRGINYDDSRSGSKSLYSRLGRERKPYDRPEPSARGGARRERGLVSQEELDRELEGLRNGDRMDLDDDGEAEPVRRKGRGFGQNGGRGRERERRARDPRGKEDLDRELDDMFASRTE